MNEQYYEFFLFDPATPSFVSMPKRYIGSKSDLLAVADHLAKEEYYEDTVEGIRAFFKGRTDATHSIAYQTIPVLQPVRVLEKTELILGEREWDHINVWGCPYHMHFRTAEVSQLLVQLEGSYLRFVRAKITDFGYRGFRDSWQPIGGFILGNASVLDIRDRGDGRYDFSNILYVCEDVSESLEEQQLKMRNPDAVVFDQICEEVFGDG